MFKTHEERLLNNMLISSLSNGFHREFSLPTIAILLPVSLMFSKRSELCKECREWHTQSISEKVAHETFKIR